MKKLLLLTLLLSFGVIAFAQKANLKAPKDAQKIEVRKNFSDAEPSIYSPAALPSKTMKKSVNDVLKIPMTSSFNIFTSLVAEQTCLIYNEELNLIMHTSRANPPAIGAVSGDIVTNLSQDGGTTWTPVLALANGNAHRYPSGVIYNPEGNTTFTEGYSLVVGPRTPGTGWSHNFYSSLKFDGTNLDIQYRPASGTGDLLQRDGLTCNNDGIAHVAGNQYTVNSLNYITGYRGDVRKGVFNTGTNSFDWTEQDVTPDILMKSDGTAYVGGTTNMAWSQDGMVGYFIFTGVDNRPAIKSSYSPIVYKTTDAGETWNLLDYFDYSNNPVISPYIYSTWDPSITNPYFIESDAVVDLNNELHIFAHCIGSSALDPDSLGYIWTINGNQEKGAIFECYTQGSDWMVHFVDTLQSSAPDPTQTGYGTGVDAIGWDMRLQASRTVDGTKVFCTWTDTDPITFGTELNLNPDLWAWGRDVTYATIPASPVNFTALTDAWGECYFSYTSGITMTKSEGGLPVYEIPVMYSDIHTTNDPGLPVYHYYLQGIKFPEDYFVTIGIDEVKTKTMVSQNIPNPFSGRTKIEVNLLNNADLSLSIFNLTGQKVYDLNNGYTSAGNHTLTVDAGNLKAGVYYYTVKAGENKVTRKMIVK
jgi:hypothetical protein